MGKPVFAGERVISHKSGMRSYVNPSAYEPTPPTPPDEFRLDPKFVYLGLGLVIVSGLAWFIFASPFFKVTSIQIKGEAKDETKLAVETLRGKNIFLIGGQKAEENIAKQQPGIKQIKVLRGLPNTVVIELVERDPAIVWQTQDKNFLVDKDGYVFKESDGNYPKIKDGKNLPVDIGGRISNQTFILFIQGLVSNLPTTTKLEVDSIIVPETTFQIEVNTKAGPKLKFDTSRNLDDQLADVQYVLEHKKDESKKLIDIRIPGFAYIK